MKIDNSNPAQTGNMIRQKHTEKTSSENVSDSRQIENVVPMRKPNVISKDNAGNSEMINSVKVAEIKQAILEGRFKVNPEVVADRLLETVKELVQSRKNNKP